MTSFAERLKTLASERERFESEVRSKCQALMTDFIMDLFNEYPALNSFGWVQYTPYFNDGDECIFGVNSDIIINGYDKYGEFPWTDEDSERVEPDASLKGVDKLVNQMLQGLGESFLKSAFDDHVHVEIVRDGDGYKVETEEYEHE